MNLEPYDYQKGRESFEFFLKGHQIKFNSECPNIANSSNSQQTNYKIILNRKILSSMIVCLSQLKTFIVKLNGHIPMLSYAARFSDIRDSSRSVSGPYNPPIEQISPRVRNFDPNSVSFITVPKPEEGYIALDEVEIWGANILKLATPELSFDFAWGQGRSQMCLSLISKFQDKNLMKKLVVLLGHQFFALKKVLAEKVGVSNVKILEVQAQILKINLILKRMVLVFGKEDKYEIKRIAFNTLLEFLLSQ